MAAALVALVACRTPPPRHVDEVHADLVLVHGRIFTADATQPWTDAIAIRGDRIVAIGEAAKHVAAGRRIELGGRLVIPGIHDAHVHEPSLFVAQDIEGDERDDATTTLAHIARATHDVPAGTWLHVVLGAPSIDGNGLAREMLDRVAPDHPLWIDNSTGHVVVMNSLAEQQLGVFANPARPGWHFEYERYRAMHQRGLAASDDDVAIAVDAFEAQEIAWGVTSVTAFPLDVDADRLATVLRASPRKLRWHVVRSPLDGVIKPPPPSSTDRVVVEGTKYFIDGMPAERGAALALPYDDVPGSGSLDFSLEQIGSMLEASRDTGDTLHVHAVGDRAIATVLDADERVPGAHLVIEHAHLITADDIARARRLGVSIVATPFHGQQKVNQLRLGSARLQRWMPLHDLVAAGIPLALGSDGPQNPFVMIAEAEGQNLTSDQALGAAAHGPLRIGEPADLAVLTGKPDDPATRSVLTLVGGEIVYDALSPASAPSSARTE